MGELEPVTSLQREYLFDDVYQKKVSDLEKHYKHIRRTRPDGNCFFRAFAYGYLEKLLSCPDEYKRFHEVATGSKDNLVALGFPKFTVEDFHETVSIKAQPSRSYRKLSRVENEKLIERELISKACCFQSFPHLTGSASKW